jgi:hypothetical protein
MYEAFCDVQDIVEYAPGVMGFAENVIEHVGAGAGVHASDT